MNVKRVKSCDIVNSGSYYSSSARFIFRFCIYLRVEYIASGVMVRKSIVKNTLSPVIFIFIATFNPSMLSVTRAKDNANDRTSLSR